VNTAFDSSSVRGRIIRIKWVKSKKLDDVSYVINFIVTTQLRFNLQLSYQGRYLHSAAHVELLHCAPRVKEIRNDEEVGSVSIFRRSSAGILLPVRFVELERTIGK